MRMMEGMRMEREGRIVSSTEGCKWGWWKGWGWLWTSRLMHDLLFLLIWVAYEESRTANQKPENLRFCAPFNKRTFIGRNPARIFNQRGEEFLKQKSNAQWILLKLSGSVLRVSNSELFSSGNILFI